MIAFWMLYVLLVSAGIAVVALAAERVLLLVGSPVRYVWVAALGLAMLLIADMPARYSGSQSHSVPDAQRRGALQADSVLARHRPTSAQLWRHLRRPTLLIPSDSPVTRLDAPLIAFWISGSLLAVAMLVGGARSLATLRSSAEASLVDDIDVLLSDTAGPFAVGFWRQDIVFPRWALNLSRNERCLVLAHEVEHARKRDPALITCSALFTALMPWNLALWWMLRQVRRAAEFDCDRRVLRRHPDRRAYAELLVSIAGRTGDDTTPGAVCAASASFLERRFRLMTARVPRFRTYRVLGGVAFAGLLASAVAMVPRPTAGAARRTVGTAGPKPKHVTAYLEVTSRSATNPHMRFDMEAAGVGEGLNVVSTTRSRLTTPAELSVDLTRSGAHLDCDTGCVLHVEARFKGGPASQASADGRHVTVPQGGIGIEMRP